MIGLQALANTASRLLAVSFLFLATVIVARVLGPEGNGHYTVAITFAAMVTQFANLGLHVGNIYQLAQDPKRLAPIIGNSLVVSVLLGGVSAVCSVLVLIGSGQMSQAELSFLWLGAAMAPCRLFFTLGGNIFVGLNRMRMFNFFSVLNYLLILVGIVGAVTLGGNIQTFLWVTLAGWLSSCVILLWQLMRVTGFRLEFSWPLFREGFLYAVKAYVVCLLGFLMLRANVFLLEGMVGPAEVGLYAVPSQLLDALNLLPASLALVMFPRLVKEGQERWQMTLKGTAAIGAFMLLACLGVGLIGEPAVRLAFGEKYLAAMPATYWMLPGALFLGMTSVSSQYVAATGFPRASLGIWTLGLMCTFVTGRILIPAWGSMGASASLSISYGLVFVLQMGLVWFLEKEQTGKFPSWNLFSSSLSSSLEKEPVMDCALIGYPLSDNYRQKFEQMIGGSPRYISLQELRRQSIFKTLKTLLGLKPDRLFIAVEGQSTQALLPVFYCFAGVSRAKKIEVITPDFQCRRISRLQTVTSLAATISASIGCRMSLKQCRGELQQLQKLARIPDAPLSEPSLFYLKSNLWLGVQAGGSVGHVAGVVNSLLTRGYGIDFAGTESPLMVKPGVNFIPLDLPETYGIPYELNLFRFQQQMAGQLQRRLRGKKYGFLYQRLSVSNYAGVQLSRQMNIPLVIEYNGSEVWAQKNWGVAFKDGDASLLAEDVSLQHAHAVVTVSEVLRDELIARGVEPKRIVTHPNGIDPEVYNPERFGPKTAEQIKAKWNIAADARLATFVGTFGPWHGVEVLAEAIRHLATNSAEWLRAQKLHFVIVGDGLRMPQVKEILNHESCKPFVTLTGLIPQAETPQYMAAADILLSPHVPNADGTRFFGSPTKLFEYMVMGKPIIASDLEQIGTVLANSVRVGDLPSGKPGANESRISVLCRPGNVEDLMEGIRFLAERPEWGVCLGRNVREEALQKYTWDRHVDSILERLEELGAQGVSAAESHKQHLLKAA